MSKIVQDYKDLHVIKTLVYVKDDDAYAYSDEDLTVKIDAVDLVEIFNKGAIVVSGTTSYEPTSCSLVGGVATITYVTADGTTATTAVLATLASSEFAG